MKVCAALVLGAGCFFFQSPLYANDFMLNSGRTYNINVKSFRAQKFEQVVPQHYDFSCGAAALATLLKYHYDINVTEQKVLDSMFAVGNQDKIRKQGFSLLDMKNYLHTIGLPADGYKVSIKSISKVGVPGIVLINANGYMHFVVVKGISDKHVLLGDPALGMRKVSMDTFLSMWNGIFFIVKTNFQIGQASFKMENDKWEGRRGALFSNAMSHQALSQFTVHTAYTPNIYQGF
jgi:hypothetical protein